MITNNRLTPEQYAQNFSRHSPAFRWNKEAALIEANRCLFCYDAPCIKQCPTSINIPKFIKQITTDNIRGSAKTIFDSQTSFGGGCSRVCPVEKLCEGSCVYNLLHEAPIPIANLQRYSTDGAIKEEVATVSTARLQRVKRLPLLVRVRRDLSCAHVLSRQGIDVTVFEKEAKGGGLMTYGIAAYKVTPQFCQDEVDFITSLGGITVEYNKALGKDFTLADLRVQV